MNAFFFFSRKEEWHFVWIGIWINIKGEGNDPMGFKSTDNRGMEQLKVLARFSHVSEVARKLQLQVPRVDSILCGSF